MATKKSIEAFGRFVGALVNGDMNSAVDVLKEEPGTPVEKSCDGCAAKSHKEGDPACSAEDGDFRCVAHGPEGTCIMGRKP
jgi:hypothetical protein